MTLQNLQNEAEKEIESIFEPILDDPCDESCEINVDLTMIHIKEWHKTQLEKAYQVGREDMKDTKQTCNCKEMTCQEGCARNHTHKGFSCEKCEVKDTKTIEHCGEKNCPECNLEAYKQGSLETLRTLEQEVEGLKEEMIPNETQLIRKVIHNNALYKVLEIIKKYKQ